MKKTLYFLILIVFSIAGCSQKKPQDMPEIQVPLSSIMVMPATFATSSKEPSVKELDELQNGMSFMNVLLRRELTGEPKFSFGNYQSIANSNSAIQAAIQHARNRGADGVFIATIGKYQERVGGSMAVESPAAAEFTLRIFDTRTKKILWVSNFDETQEAFMSNIFSFNKMKNRGFKWISVEDMVTQAVQEKLKECPYL